jgi:hypothetical protein
MAEPPRYREEGSLVIRIDLAADFDESYEGDDDGLAWLTAFREQVQPRIIRAIFDAVRGDSRFDALPVSRGAAPDENVDIEVRFRGRR